MWILAALGILALASGAGAAMQGVVNAAVTRTTGLWAATFISFTTGTVWMLAATLASGQGTTRKALSLPTWLLLTSGTLGAAIIVCRTWLVPKVGVGATMAFFVVGQLLASALLDHFGLMGIRQIPLTSAKILGIVLMILGMLLVVRTGAPS
jgi:transporter family-2 protein